MHLLTPIQESLNTYFGFSTFRPGQAEAIQSLLSGQNTLVVMPTGAGKSLIFQLAALLLGADPRHASTTLVISPLIALMKDQVDSLIRRNIPATYINSALPSAEQTNRLQQFANGRYRLVYIAPERLRSSSFLEALRRQPISLIAVDEAHCISEWGHDFRPDYLHIAEWRKSIFPDILTIALTATATPQVQKDILRLLGLEESSTCIVTGFNRPNLSLNVRYTSGLPAKLRALNELLSPPQSGASLIYTGTRRDAEEVAEFAREVVCTPAEYYHAGLPAEERTRIQENFIHGNLNLIVATNAFGMGIDRADVRQVIHYSLTGSLEAYYQEAGRAGRDGLPASVTLLYDPHDRALHEFFIQQSELGTGDLNAIFKALPGGKEIWSTTDDLSRQTGLHPVQIKVGLSILERAGALAHLGDEGFRMMFRRGMWKLPDIEIAILHGKQHVLNRQKQLDDVVQYAESNHCRRKIILRHFGDSDSAQVDDCCDNCKVQKATPSTVGNINAMNYAERAGLIILDCIRRLKIKVGQGKLAQILHGSKAKDVLNFHHDKNAYYGRLATVKQSDIKALIEQLVEKGYIKIIGGEYPILSLTPLGENAISKRESLVLKYPKSPDTTELRSARAKPEAGNKLDVTARLFADGLNPEQIACARGLSPTTIYLHFADLITASRLTAAQVVPVEKLIKIEAVIRQIGSTQYLAPIKELLPVEIDYNLIRCVVAEHLRQRTITDETELAITPSPIKPGDLIQHIVELGKIQCQDGIPELISALNSSNGNVRRLAASALGKIRACQAVDPLLKLLQKETKPQVRQYIVKALGRIGDRRAVIALAKINDDELEKYYVRASAQHALKKIANRKGNNFAPATPTPVIETSYTDVPDPISSFLNSSHPRPLTGAWHTGWSLGFHSRFSGGDWSRSDVGDMIYRLKYDGDISILPTLVKQTLELMQAHPELGKVDFILPVPSSTERKINPVQVFCDALAAKLNLQVQVLIAKSRVTQPQKEMKTLAQKRENVAGAFTLRGEIRNKRFLLVDDLFDSGATLEEITCLLLRHGAARVNVLALTRTIHSDS